MRKIYSAITGLCLIAAGTGCNLTDIEDPIIVPAVEKEFFVEMREQLGTPPRNLSVWLRTIKVQNCLNSSIRYEIAETPSRIRIDIEGINTPTDCMPGAAQARETIEVSPLVPGLISFDINLKNTVNNQGTLHITPEVYTLNLATEEGLVITNNQLRRIPDHTIWGYVTYSLPPGQIVAGNFINELAALSSAGSFTPGNYGYFSVPSTGSSFGISESPADPNIRTFVHRFTGNMDDLRSLVQSYRNDHGSLIQIKLTTSTGESI